MLDDTTVIKVTDLKQYAYCPRIIFYEHCLPHIRPRTFKMDAGREQHESQRNRAERRNLSAYGIASGRRVFDLAIGSERLGLVGEIDEVVYADSGEIFPVDYKLTPHVRHNYKLQLTAYAMLLEDLEQTSVHRGFLYLIPTRKCVEIQITEKLRKIVLDQLTALLQMIAHETMPAPAPIAARCHTCEFRLFCNDV